MRQRCATYEQIVAEYPKIFPKDFHFECGPGWITLIDGLCACIQHHVDWKISQAAYAKEPPPDASIQPVAAQVKEKFAGLRFYVDGGDDATYGMITHAELMSTTICEECGNLGTLRGGNWLRTLCDKHHEENVARIAAENAKWEERRRLRAEEEERKRQEVK